MSELASEPSASGVDPQVQVILDYMAGNATVPLAEMTPEQLRAGMESTAMARSDDGLAAVEDTSIAGVPVRVYRPNDVRTSGTVVFFHGGGFTVGSIHSHDALAAQLAVASASVLVSVEYRLAPEHPFPAAVDDCWAVTQAVSGPVAVVGDSAGGNLSAVVALLARDAGVAVVQQSLLYPVVHLGGDYPSRHENANGYMLTAEAITYFDDKYLSRPDDAKDWRASPMLADLHGVAPALVVTAEFDPLRDEGELYGRKLAEAGVPVVVHRYDGMIHGFAQFPVTQAAELVDEVGAAIRDGFKTAGALD